MAVNLVLTMAVELELKFHAPAPGI